MSFRSLCINFVELATNGFWSIISMFSIFEQIDRTLGTGGCTYDQC